MNPKIEAARLLVRRISWMCGKGEIDLSLASDLVNAICRHHGFDSKTWDALMASVSGTGGNLTESEQRMLEQAKTQIRQLDHTWTASTTSYVLAPAPAPGPPPIDIFFERYEKQLKEGGSDQG
jgi:hypothetical protein